MIRVSIAAPTPMMRAGLRAMLASSAEVQVVGEGASLVEAASELPNADVLVVTDEELPEDWGRTISDDGAQAIVVLSDDERPASALNRLPLRGWAIVPRDAGASELQAAVLAAAQGMVVLPPNVARQLLAPRQAVEALDSGLLNEPLTARELEVLELISQGLPNKLIARKLQISEHTVKFHVSAIYTKLGASNRTDAVSRGARFGLVTL